MPTYTYACTSCGHRFDIYQAFSDNALTECPQCGGPLRKEFGNVGVVFKGSGFYRNDARKGAKTESSSGSSSSGTSSSDSASSSTGDTKAPATSSSGGSSSGGTGGSTTTGSSSSKPAG